MAKRKKGKKVQKLNWVLMLHSPASFWVALTHLRHAKGIKLKSCNFAYETVSFEAKTKAIHKVIDHLVERNVKFTLLDSDIYRKSSSFIAKELKDRSGVEIPITPAKTIKGKCADYFIVDELAIPEEVKDGKNLSESIGVRKEALNTEKIDLSIGKNRSTGGEDGYLPDADPGRPTGSEEEPVDPQVEVRDVTSKPITDLKKRLEEIADRYFKPSPSDCDADSMWLTIEEYSMKYKVPTRTIRNWIEKGILKSDIRYGIATPKITIVKDTRDHCPWKPDISEQIARSKPVPWEWLDWTTYCLRRFGSFEPFGCVKYDD